MALTAGDGTQAQPRPLWESLEPGEHEVGFHRLWEMDESRVWPRSPALDSSQGSVARPVRVDVWYPASCGSTSPMPFGAYVDIESPGPAFDDLVFLTHRWDEYSYRGLAEDSTDYDRLMGVATAACLGAPPAPGRFPVVVYSAGWFNRTPDNTVLAEFLASHGFVVAAVPQVNPGLWTFSFRSDAAGVENQTRDVEVALAAVTRQPYADRRRVAAMGYSTGGDVALLLAGRNPLVDAVVGLDASWTLGPENDVQSSPFFVPSEHRVPILAVRRPSNERAGFDAVLDSLAAAPRLLVEVPDSDHGTYADDPRLRRLLGMGATEPEAAGAAVAETVLRFVQATLGRGPFDGLELARHYRAGGLTPAYLPASPVRGVEEAE